MAHVKAMEALAQRYPQDDEAQIAYAILLNVSAPLGDKTYAQQLKGAAILEPISKRQPLHPGATHYLIHLYDYPPLAQKGLAAANRYAKIAPAAPHAQHMPSHIYTRVGYWKESIAANTGSVKAAKAEKSVGNYLHAQDYMIYAHLQLAQDKQARAVMDEMMQARNFNPTISGGNYALAAAPARYAVERNDWSGAAQLEVRPNAFGYVMAISHFARALGAARSGNPAAAKADVAKLTEMRDDLRKANEAYWSEIVDIQQQVAAAWVLYAEGKHDEALRAMSAAADAEDKTEKHVVTPGPLAPARELYGYMLLDRGMAREALAAFELTQEKEPNRYHGFAGAAQAAERLGDKAKAKANYEKLIALVGDANDRPEIACGAALPGEQLTRTVAAMKPLAIVAATGLGAGVLVGALILTADKLFDRRLTGVVSTGWTETQWPFPTDQFGRGKAFQCGARDCGTPVKLYVRAKIGFCNCETGVDDDAELERIGDLDLLGGKAAAQGDGRSIAVAHMKGRSRSYVLTAQDQPGLSALSIGYNDRCDAIVATAVVKHERPADIEPGIIAFLNSPTVMRWAEVTLGL